MAITVPIAGQEISASTFGVPVANEVNRLGLSGYFRYKKSAVQSSAVGANTITYPVRVLDTQVLWNGSQFTCPASLAGLWIFTASINNSTPWSDGLNINLNVNGVQLTWTQYPVGGAVPIAAATTGLAVMAAGDVMAVSCYTNAAGASIGGTWDSHLIGALLRPA